MARKLKYNLFAEFNRDGKLDKIETIRYKPEKISTVAIHEQEQYLDENGDKKWKPVEKVHEHIFTNDQEPDKPGKAPVITFEDSLVEGEPLKPVEIKATITDADGNDTIKSVVWLQTFGEAAAFTPSEDQRSITVIAPKDGDYTFSCTATDMTDRIGTGLATVRARTIVEPPVCPEGEHWDPQQQKCVPDEEPHECPPGQHWDGEKCVPDEQPTDETFSKTVAVFGDSNSGSVAVKTFGNIDQTGAKVLAVGDFEYDSDFDDFKSKYGGLKAKTIMAYRGNHDDTEDESSTIKAANEEYWSWKIPAIGKAVVGNIGFFSIDTQASIAGQKAAVEANIKALAEDPAIDFIIGGSHKPFYSPKTKHAEEVEFRQAFQPIFDKYQVDAFYCGHEHLCFTSYPIVTGGQKKFESREAGVYDFAKAHGQIYIGSGNAGRDFHKVESNPAYIQFSSDENFGYALIETSSKSNKRLRFRQMNNSGQTLHSIIIDKTAGGGTFPPECPTGEHWDTALGKCVPDVVEPPVCPEGQHWDAAQGKCVPDTEPPTGDVLKFIEQGQEVSYKKTGKKVEMEVGSDHRNGQRFNVRHKFKNYVMLGNFLTGAGQEKIEMKTDGGCHGCSGNPTDVPIGMWYEVGVNVADGQVELQTEYPHPDNHDVPIERAYFVKDVAGDLTQNWVTYAVMAYTNKDGHRVIKQFAKAGKNQTAELSLGAVDKEAGWIFPKTFDGKTLPFPRDMDAVINGQPDDEGLEAEIRMHGATNHDTKFENCFVWEIVPPT